MDSNSAKPRILAAIVLIILAAWYQSKWILVAGAGLGAFVLYSAYSFSRARGRTTANKTGSWSFGGDYTKPYGSRCIDDGTPCSKYECEVYSLSPMEAVPDLQNIIQFTHDRGIVFPVPYKFLMKTSSLQQNMDDYAKFKRDGMSQLVANYVKTCRLFIFENMISHLNGVYYWNLIIDQITKGDYKYEKLAEYMDVCYNPGKARALINDIDANGSAPCYDYMEILFAPNENDDEMPLSMALDSQDGGISVVFVNRSYVDPHANALIIDHDHKTIYHFEPHVGYKYDNIRDSVMDFITPLLSEYTFSGTEQLPKGLQALTGDGYCASWSLFASMLFILNRGKNPAELLDYMIGMGGNATEIIDSFLFFIYKKYNGLFTDHKIQIAIESMDIERVQLRDYLRGTFAEKVLLINAKYPTYYDKTIYRIRAILKSLEGALDDMFDQIDDLRDYWDIDINSTHYAVEDAISKSNNLLSIMDGDDTLTEHSITALMRDFGDSVARHVPRNMYGKEIAQQEGECVLF